MSESTPSKAKVETTVAPVTSHSFKVGDKVKCPSPIIEDKGKLLDCKVQEVKGDKATVVTEDSKHCFDCTLDKMKKV